MFFEWDVNSKLQNKYLNKLSTRKLPIAKGFMSVYWHNIFDIKL